MPGRPFCLLLALALDGLLADPAPGHPVRLIGFLGHQFYRLTSPLGRLGGGITLLGVGLILELLAGLSIKLFKGFEVLWLFYALALTSLRREVQKVHQALEKGDLPLARKRLSCLVSRRTEELDQAGVVRGALETLAENFNDGFVGPIFWYAVAGWPGLIFYKVAETLDSMYGYPYGPYRRFGYVIARTDDLLNYLPARLSALFIAAAAALGGGSFRSSWQTAWRYAPEHPSPNAGWPEAALAGALGISLGGPAPYPQGWEQRPWLGNFRAQPEPSSIPRALKIIYRAAGLAVLAAFSGLFLTT